MINRYELKSVVKSVYQRQVIHKLGVLVFEMPSITSSSSSIASSLVELRDKKISHSSTSLVAYDPKTASKRASVKNIGCVSLKHYDSLLCEFKCPGCAKPFESPIKLCATGHSICHLCTTRLKYCPLCKDQFTDMRSLTLEAVTERVHFHCPNQQRGCAVRLPLQLLKPHEHECIYKINECFMGKVWETCDWRGREIDWLEHCYEFHADKMISSNELTTTWNYNDDYQRTKSIIGYFIFNIYDETFNLYHIYDKNSSKIVWTVLCPTKELRINQKYAFELELFTPNCSANLLVQRYPCHAQRDDDILEKGKCAEIRVSDAIRFMGSERILHYRIRIIRLNPMPIGTIRLSSGNILSIEDTETTAKPLPIDYDFVDNEHGNYKKVPNENIIRRKSESTVLEDTTENQTIESDNEKIPSVGNDTTTDPKRSDGSSTNSDEAWEVIKNELTNADITASPDSPLLDPAPTKFKSMSSINKNSALANPFQKEFYEMKEINIIQKPPRRNLPNNKQFSRTKSEMTLPSHNDEVSRGNSLDARRTNVKKEIEQAIFDDGDDGDNGKSPSLPTTPQPHKVAEFVKNNVF